MLKKIIQYTIIAACIGLIGYVYYQFSKTEKESTDSYNAVPSNVSVLLEVNFKSNLRSYFPWLSTIVRPRSEVLLKNSPIISWPSFIATLDSLRAFDASWNKVISNSSLVIASHPQMLSDSWFFSIGLSEEALDQSIQPLLEKYTPISGSRKFKDVTIYQGQKEQFTIINKCLVGATSSSLIEDIILRLKKDDFIHSQPQFSSAYSNISEDSPLHFFFNLNNGEWLQLDPTLFDSSVSLNGYAVLSASALSPISLVNKGETPHIADYLPSDTKFLDVLSYSNFEEGWTKHEDRNSGKSASKYWNQAWKAYGDTCNCDLNEILLSWRSNEWGSAIVGSGENSTSKLLFIKSTIENVADKLKPILKKTDKEGIFQILYPQLFDRNKPETFLIECNYVTQVGNIVFFSESIGTLLPLASTLSKLSDSNNFRLSTKSIGKSPGRIIFQTEYYISPLSESITRIFGGDAYMTTAIEHFKENKYLVSLILPNNSNGSSHEISDNTSASNISEDGELITIDFLPHSWQVVNHNTKLAETLKQNNPSEISLYDSEGKLLWQRKTSGNIVGDVIQIDALKNNKLQFAFVTENALYIIDRNGNNLAGFPIQIKSQIKSPLHVANYEKDKNYRLLFASSEGIENYSVVGAKTKGWKVNSSSSVFITDFKIGTTDYLLSVDKIGSVSLLKRTGETLSTDKVQLNGYDGRKCVITQGISLEDTQITYTTTEGEVKTVEIGK